MSLKRILKNELKKSNSVQEFFDKIHNIREKEELVIMGTGTTLSKYTDEEIYNILKDKDVFSIKQAYLKFPERTDVHFFNCCNLPIDGYFYGYKYPDKDKPLVLASSPFHLGGGRWSKGQHMDMFFKIPTVNQNHLNDENVNFLCKKGNIDDYLFSRNLSRPSGPGIFFEVAMYYAFHLGYKKIYTIGWDYSYNKQNYGHFYSPDNKKAKNVRIPAMIPQSEIEYVLKFTDKLYDWLEQNGIELNVIGDISAVSPKFKRILKLKEIT